MSIITTFIKTLPALISAGNLGCIIAILLIAIVGYYFHMKVVRKLSMGVCEYKDNCKLESFKTNRTIMLSKIRTIMNTTKDKFASDLIDYIRSGNEIDEQTKNRIIYVHGNLMMAVFFEFTLDAESMLLFNNLPKPHTDEFNSVIEDRFNAFWSNLWSKYKVGYNQDFYRLDLGDRVTLNEFHKHEYFEIFKEMFKLAYKNTHKKKEDN